MYVALLPQAVRGRKCNAATAASFAVNERLALKGNNFRRRRYTVTHASGSINEHRKQDVVLSEAMHTCLVRVSSWRVMHEVLFRAVLPLSL